jgi:hypothetical protein
MIWLPLPPLPEVKAAWSSPELYVTSPYMLLYPVLMRADPPSWGVLGGTEYAIAVLNCTADNTGAGPPEANPNGLDTAQATSLLEPAK